ncbi:hypothetical protein HID58_039770, partial [Brassica napus]
KQPVAHRPNRFRNRSKLNHSFPKERLKYSLPVYMAAVFHAAEEVLRAFAARDNKKSDDHSQASSSFGY